MVLHLVLTTLAGEETQLAIELQEYDRFYEFEHAVLEQLPHIGESSTFGCELDFVCRETHRKLVDPIWSTLRNNNSFTVISYPCFEEAEHKGQMKGDAKAIRVPCLSSSLGVDVNVPLLARICQLGRERTTARPVRSLWEIISYLLPLLRAE